MTCRMAQELRAAVFHGLWPLGRFTKVSVTSVVLRIVALSYAGGISYVQYRRLLMMHTSLRLGKSLWGICPS